MWLRFIVRDLCVVAATTALWWEDITLRQAEAVGGLPVAVGIATGGMTALCAYLAHEWGHLIGSVASGATVQPADRLTRPHLFRFDTTSSDRRQFLAMSAGGYVASIAGLGAIVALVPRDTFSGLVTLVLAAMGVLATLVLEVPVTWRALRGDPLPTGGPYAGDAAAGDEAPPADAAEPLSPEPSPIRPDSRDGRPP